MPRTQQRRSSPKLIAENGCQQALPIDKTKLIKRNPSKIQLVPVLNPRVLYYIGQLSNEQSFFEVDELKDLTISESLLDICVGMLADDNLVPDKLKRIPVTKILDISNHIEKAIQQLPLNEGFYSPFIPVYSPVYQLDLNWILHNIILTDTHWLSWEYYWDDFHAGVYPQLKNTKIQAEKVLRSPFFKVFAKWNSDFMKNDLCNVRRALLMAGLYKNAEGNIDPYDWLGQKRRNKINNTTFSATEQIDLDFSLEWILSKDFFNDSEMSKTEIINFYETMFETMLLNWEVCVRYFFYPFFLFRPTGYWKSKKRSHRE